MNLIQGDTASPWPFQHVDKRAKLSNSAITSVYMDQNDYVWLGTWDGLNRYDGSAIKVYKPDPFLKGTISNNVVRNFLEDGKGNLWIVTHMGINQYDRKTDSFRTYLDSLNDIPFLEYNIKACIGPDGAVWTSLIGKGISRYDFDEDRFVPVDIQGVDPEWLASVINLGQHGGLLYLLGADGKLVCTVNNRVVFSKQLVDRKPVAFHAFLRIGQRYILALATGAKNLMFYDLGDIEKDPERINMGTGTVSSLSESLDRSALWLGTEEGDIFKVKASDDGFSVRSMNSYFPAFSKARIKILTITETKQDIVWVGTDGDGVYKFLTRAKTFYSVPKGQPDSGQLSHSIIRSIYEDESGTLYIGTRGGGLNVLQADTRTRVIGTTNGLSNDAVLAIKKDHDGNIWIGLDGEGIDMIEKGTNRIFHFPRDFENATDLSFGSVYAICVDAFNDLWLGTSGYGIIHMKVARTPRGYRLEESDQLSHPDKSRAIAIKSNIVYTIVEEKPNTLWFGTRGGGIYRYNALTKKIEDHIQADVPGRKGLSNNDVLSLYLDEHDQLWVGTSGGLNRIFLQRRPFRVQHFTQHEGLPNNTIHGILEDPKGNIWLSTNHGLVMYNTAKNTFRNFDTNDGLQNTEFTDGAAFRSATSEKLFFGGIDGLDIVHPSKLDLQNYFPRLAVTEFQVRNATITAGDESKILSRNIDQTADVTLKYDQNFISFFFTTLDYWNKQKSEYAYFLENFDKDWNYIGQQQSVTLTNIPPGHYRLNINYTNENGAWSPSPRIINIVVTPPFWRTAWAYGFYILMGIALQAGIVLYIRWRTKAKRAMAMEKFKAHQLKELNDYKLQFFTNVAHEFRTPLTLIFGPVASLLHKSKDPFEQQQLKTVYTNSLRLQKLIDELIQFRKIESGKDVLTLSTIDLVPFTQEIIESFQQHAADYEVYLEFYPEPDTLPALVDHKKIEKILINLISNGIKYNTRGGMVGVSLNVSNSRAIFTIRDEGIGIAENNTDKIFQSFYHNPDETLDPNGFAKSTGIGLSLTRSMVHMHRGEIRVDSKVGKGSMFTVAIPIVREAYADLPEETAMILPSTNLNEKVSLEFDIDHMAIQPGKQSSPANTHPYALLVVDDNASIITLLESMLSGKYV
ncbi:MAG TPA: two-component regulator propeller domain-containing protein, partial [Ohtaekwangia sp.]|nr:two-component regulator propeller domain-containing protein [Ohtaekwangia sp.]